MHDPYELYPVLKTNTQVESIAAYDGYLICGTSKGDLILYSVISKGPSEKTEVQLLRYNKNVYRKPIQQLAVIPQFNILIILSDSTIYVHDLSVMKLPLISTLHKSKGASLFAVDVENQIEKSLTHKEKYIVRLCVAVKRKLQVFYWKNNEFLELGEDINVSDIPKSLALCKESICVGFKGEYAMIPLNDTEDGRKQKDLFPTGKNLEPYLIQLTDSTFALIRDSHTIFVDTKGNLLVKNALKWSEIPTAMAYDEPYLLALLSETIEVRAMQPSLLVQNIKIPGAQLICRSSVGMLYVLADKQVFQVRAIPAADQIRMLLDEKQFQLALKLCNISDDSEEKKIKKRHEIQTLYAYDLFHHKEYQESMKQFLELDTHPYDVIRLFPNLLPQYSPDDSSSSDSLTTAMGNRDSDRSLQALIDYLTEARLKLLSDNTKKGTAEQEHMLRIIDTTLLKCYLNTNDALIAPLLRLNNCNVEESEKILKKHKKYSELIILYQTKGLHHKALELLEKQADQQDSSLRGVERTIQYLQNLGSNYIDLILRFAGWVLDKYPEDGLKIFTEDLSEVENLPRPKVLDYLLKTHKQLVIPYLEHVIYNWNDKSAIMHNALAHQYREKVLELCNPLCLSSEQVAGQNMRTKLINFLEKSEYYTPETVHSHLPFDGLYEERAVLRGKLGLHEQALAIYVMVLNDIEKAVKYCDRVYKTGGTNASQVYVYLLQLLIKPQENLLVGVQPPAPPQPDVEMALTLLEGNATKIPPEKALPILPKDIPVRRIKHYLTVSLSEHLNMKRKCQISRGLQYAEHLQVQQLRIQFESQNISLTEWNICSVCKKRFSNQSAFIRNPNGDVIHLSCQDQEQSIST